MKLKGILLFLSLTLVSMTAWGIPLTEKSSTEHDEKVELSTINSKAMTKAEVKAMKKADRQQKKLERKQAYYKKAISKKMEKYGVVDFSDPVKKWMWFWIFGWAAGLLLWIISWTVITSGGIGTFGVFGLLGSLAWLFGTVCLVIWLVKMAA